MSRGKDICQELKAVRKRIAEENGIELEIPECTYHGPCKGTCPKCESEVRYLENALAQRIRMGKVATVAGLALTLGVSGSAAAQSENCRQEAGAPSSVVMQKQVGVVVTGTVVDSLTKEPLPFANILVFKEGKPLTGATTDFDGNFKLQLEEGEYEFLISFVGSAQKRFPVKVPDDLPLKLIELESTGEPLEGILIEGGAPPIIEIGPEGTTHTEINGVPLLIQY